MSIQLTHDLGRFIATTRFKDIPEAAVATSRTAYADTIGVMLAGAHEQAPKLLKAMLAPTGGESALYVDGGRASALDAAWINATAAHVLDYDDTAQRGGHTGAVLVSAILAEAEALGASGEQMILAHVVGYETIADLVARDRDEHLDKGWHPTGILGTIGAAAACASLRKLDATKAAMAIALGASQSAGVISNFGTMTKPFHAGKAAHAGVASARLAEIGFTASMDALEHAPSFLGAVSPAGRIDVDTPMQAGSAWDICSANRPAIKKYPLCYASHRAVDGLHDLLQSNTIAAHDIERITVTLSRRNSNNLRHHLPQTGLEAKFSIEFPIASMLIAGRAGLAQLQDAFVRKPEVQALMKRVAIEIEERLDTERAGFAIHDRVVVTMRDGRKFDTGPITHVRGDHALPLGHDDLWNKFEDCVQTGNPRIQARKLFDTLMTLDRLPHVRELVAMLI